MIYHHCDNVLTNVEMEMDPGGEWVVIIVGWGWLGGKDGWGGRGGVGRG